jgi:putative ABC transport system permease protein
VRPLAELRLAVRLARREMRVGLRGFGVFLWCLFLGVFAVSAVGSFSESARRGLMSDARALLGGDVEIRLTHRELTPRQREFIESRGRISAIAEMRSMTGPARAGEPAPGAEKRVLVELKAVDAAYPLFGRMVLAPDQPLSQALALRAGVHGAVVEDTLLKRLGLELGDRVAVGRGEVQVRAVVVSEPDRAIRGFNLGPRLLVGRASLSGTGLLEPGSLVRHAYRVQLQVRPATSWTG